MQDIPSFKIIKNAKIMMKLPKNHVWNNSSLTNILLTYFFNEYNFDLLKKFFKKIYPNNNSLMSLFYEKNIYPNNNCHTYYYFMKKI